MLQQNGKPVRLVIVGDGPVRREVENCLRESCLDPKALLLGYRADVERLYGVFDTFVLNSFAEGMSNTLLEAMASGLPIVCTAVGGNVELVENRRTGIVVPSGDVHALAEAIRAFMVCPQDGSMCGNRARDFAVKQFSLKHMIDQYNSLYETVA
jgi:glycosyltransferase involved in cell wall biosynthesis